MGNTGVGKTFLMNAIAYEAVHKCSVKYYTTVSFVEEMENATFHREGGDSVSIFNIFADCDLLLLDDLGTERVNNSFTGYAFYSMVNERLLRGLSTVISTNLSLQDMAARYSERVVSRISKDYDFIRLFGPDLRRQ